MYLSKFLRLHLINHLLTCDPSQKQEDWILSTALKAVILVEENKATETIGPFPPENSKLLYKRHRIS